MPSITRRRLIAGGATAAGSVLGLGYAVRDRVELAVEGRPVIEDEQAAGIALLESFGDAELLSFDGGGRREFVEETDFERESVLAVQVFGSYHSEGVRFVGVERLKDGTLHSYSCVTRPSGHDDAYLYGWLVRIGTVSHSGVARHSHGGNTDVDVETG